jgi:hypothetical protein
VVGLAAVGALTHHAIWNVREARQPALRAQTHRYARLATVLVLAQLALGATLFGRFHARFATTAYAARALQAKAALGIAVFAIILPALARPRRPRPSHAQTALALLAATLGWAAALAGLALAVAHPLGTIP